MTPIADITSYIATEIPDAMTLLIEREILQAARKFFERTKIWKETQESQSTVAAQANYDVFMPDDTEVVTWDYVMYDGYDLDPVTEYELTSEQSLWRDITGTPSSYVTNIRTKSMRLYPTPNAVGTIKYELTLKPSISAATLPDFAIQQFQDVIVDGTLARMYGQAGRSWYNPDESAKRMRMFNNGIYEGTDKMIRGTSTTSQEIATTTLA